MDRIDAITHKMPKIDVKILRQRGFLYNIVITIPPVITIFIEIKIGWYVYHSQLYGWLVALFYTCDAVFVDDDL